MVAIDPWQACCSIMEVRTIQQVVERGIVASWIEIEKREFQLRNTCILVSGNMVIPFISGGGGGPDGNIVGDWKSDSVEALSSHGRSSGCKTAKT